MTPPSILVIDDNEDLREIIRTFCDVAGYAVRVASDGDAGLLEIEAFRPDVVLVDLLMPGRDGFSVLESLRTDYRHVRPGRVIAISALTDRVTVARLKALEVDAILPKPFSLSELRALLTEPVSSTE
ncbi:MAG: response regulator [Chloroflexi bacterium]|nr:response regulator [Chloroflexota bacterium]MQC27676.1 response regulator [Chloroflexota bacterium]